MLKIKGIRQIAIILAFCIISNSIITDSLKASASGNSKENAVLQGEHEVSVSEGDVSEGDVSEGDAPKTDLPEEELPKDDVLESQVNEEPIAMFSSTLLASGIDTQNTVPDTLAECVASIENGRTEFGILDADDLIQAQEYCQSGEVDGFSGITLVFLRGESSIWNISEIEGFTGIGTAENPFKGTLKCDFENDAGMQFNTDKPIVAHLGDGGTINQMNIVYSQGTAGIVGAISGDVTIQDIWLQGTMGDANQTAGIIAGSIEGGSTVTVRGVIVADGKTLAVNGAVVGGIAGVSGAVGAAGVEGNVEVILEDSVALGTKTTAITLTGTEALGGFFGIARGSHTWNLANQDSLNVALVGNAYACYTGGFAGKMEGSSADAILTVTEITSAANTSEAQNSITVNITNQGSAGRGSAGGFVGYCDSKVKIVKADGDFTIGGDIRGQYGSSGGVVGVWDQPCVELSDYIIKAYISNTYNTNNGTAGYAGGIIGKISGGKCIIKDITISDDSKTYLYGYYGCGSVVGKASDRAAVELQGTISVLKNPNADWSYKGWIVGVQDSSLIYYAYPEGKDSNGDTQLRLKDGVSITVMDEIGTYGGVFRNQKLADGMLIGDGTLENVGVIHNTISTVTEEGETWYQLNSVADFETLAIALGTNGAFGTEAFGSGVAYTDLLAGNYQVTADADISYDKTGIVALNRNDTEDVAYAFSGKMKGLEADPATITQSITCARSSNSYWGQYRVGLFSTLTGDVSFENLILDGTVSNVNGAGGLAYQSKGTGLSLKNITVQKTYSANVGTVGGVMAREYDGSGEFTLTASNITLKSQMTAGNSSHCGFINALSKANVSMENITLGGELAVSGSNDRISFLGDNWTDIGGKIKNINVENGAVLSATGVFGVLFYQVTTWDAKQLHLTLDTISLSGLQVGANTARSNCGLLIHNAQNAVVNIIDYDSTGCTVTNPGPYFDEVAGLTEPASTATHFLPNSIGIISLHKRGSSFPEYHYENKVTSLQGITNPHTTYFYDVFQYIENEDGTINEATRITGSEYLLDTPQKVLLWDVVRLSSKRNTFKNYFENTSFTNNNHTVKIDGNLDLSGISFYPISGLNTVKYIGTNDAKITFGAKVTENGIKTVDMSEWSMPNDEQISQHYGLHGGLLAPKSNINLKAENITLSGKIANIGVYSGALVAGSYGVANGGTLTNITLDDLWIADYQKEVGANASDGAPALLISKIPGKKVTFDGIEMRNYPDDSDVKAAAALIGSAGSITATDLILSFHNMKIADDVDGNAGSAHNSDVLAYASLIYCYDYTDDATINKGSGIYLFSKEDNANGMVTYGAELDNTTEFSDSSDKVVASGVDPAMYKPYVYTNAAAGAVTKVIVVNPKTGDILKGCGTYEDPYLIENERQFLTLYRFMNETGTKGSYTNDSFYSVGDGWKIIIPGTDNTFCQTKHTATWAPTVDSETGEITAGFTETVAQSAISYNYQNLYPTNKDYVFPTPEALSRAYYRLECDIDLSDIQDTTYRMIADEFMGFGTETRPFMGVWYGKGTDGVIHTVTLPDKNTSYDNYGFIQYAKGAVVKDLNIVTAHNGEGVIDAESTVTIKDAGAGVIGVVLGGDNIIDNVTVATDYVAGGANAKIGGYAGVVKKGGLILRGMDGSELATFRLKTQEGTDYYFLGSFVGKVEDGFVVYEGAGTTGDSYLWSGNGGNTQYPAIPYYNILNADKLKADCAGLTVQKENITNGYKSTITIPNAASLQVMSMALNSDALNIYPSRVNNNNYSGYMKGGYRGTSRSRKAAYSHIGDVADATQEDYLAAVKYDNINGYSGGAYDNAYAYPYLYDFMGIGTDYDDFLNEKNFSILNPGYYYYNYASSAEDNCYTEWVLASNQTYDMSQFGKSFRGLGSLYENEYNYGGFFRGNFDGKDSTILLDMTRELYGEDTTTYETARRAGLFNTLYGSTSFPYTEEVDFRNVDDSTADIRTCYVIKNINIGGSIDVMPATGKTDVAAGGVVGYISSARILFDNISMDTNNPLQIGVSNESENCNIYFTGGLIGNIKSSAYIYIHSCSLAGSETKRASLRGANQCGGLIGQVDCGSSCKVNIESSQVSYMDMRSESAYAGGMISYIKENATGNLIGTQEFPNRVEHCTIQGVQSGGFVGRIYYYSKLLASHLYSGNNTIGYCENAERAGGIAAYLEGYSQISDVVVENSDISANSYVGGVVGYWHNTNSTMRTLSNTQISDLTIEDLDNTSTSACYLGGIAGFNNNLMTLKNVHVYSTNPSEEPANYKFTITGRSTKNRAVYAGGLFGEHKDYTLYLEDCTVEAVKLYANATSGKNLWVGGFVGSLKKAVSLAGEVSVTKTDIEVPYYKYTTDKTRFAGGFLGRIENSATGGPIILCTESDTYKVYASENKVKCDVAGGIIGGSNLNTTELNGIQVRDGIVEGEEFAGGFIGELLYNGSNDTFAIKGASQTAAESPKNIVSGMTITGSYAGGFAGFITGRNNSKTAKVDIQDWVISDNEITAKWSDYNTINLIYAGGLCGVVENLGTQTFYGSDIRIENNKIVCETLGNSLSTDSKHKEVDSIGAGGVIGRVTDNNNTTYGEVLLDNISIASTNQIGVKAEASDTIQLVKYNSATSTYDLTVPELPVSSESVPITTDMEALNWLEETYGYYVGSVIGVCESKTMSVYMLASDDAKGRFVPTVLTNNTPVVDVGRKSRATTQTADSYRNLCHIIYGAENATASTYENLTDMKNEVEKVQSSYENSDTFASLLVENHVTNEDITAFETAYVETYAFGNNLSTDFPMLVYRVQDGTVQEFMEHISNVMTNAAGIPATNMGNLEITFKPMIYDGTTITDGEDGTESITASIAGRVATFTRLDYDELKDNTLCYTEATFTYGWEDASGEVHQKVFKVPIFVEEPILYSVHSMIMEGKATSVDVMKEKGAAEVSNSENGTIVYMANDSDYTILYEYTYGPARSRMADGISMDKVLYMDMSNETKSLPVGTRLVLIDVTHGNKAYYYTVESEITQVKFSDFTDAGGQKYVSKSISELPTVTDDGQAYYTDIAGHQLSDVGVEQYLVQILCGGTDTKMRTYEMHNGLYSEDSSISSRFQLEEDHMSETIWDIIAVPGLTIQFADKGTSTAITGTISENGGVNVKAKVAITANNSYWAYRNGTGTFIDSANTGKFLDIAFYLRDGNDARTKLPEGTNLSYRYEVGDGSSVTYEDSTNKAIVDNAIVYYYKDIRSLFEMEDYEYVIGNLVQDTEMSVEYNLDFSGADMSGVSEDNYYAVLELLKTSNRDYPLETNAKQDEYEVNLNAVPAKQFGFGLRADSLEDLGINTYPTPATTDTIPCHVLFDFSTILNSLTLNSDKNTIINRWSGYEYEVTYQVYQKTLNEEEVEYVPYTGSNIVISAIGWDGLIRESTAGKLTVTYEFSKEQIADGYNMDGASNVTEGLITFPCTINQNTQKLVTEEQIAGADAQYNLTNYKVLATLVIKEPGVSGAVAEETEDFLIYTVTKLIIN